MPKFYVTDGDNRFLIDTNTHIQACRKAVKYWQNKQKEIGKILRFGNYGFDSIHEANSVETKLVQGIDFND